VPAPAQDRSRPALPMCRKQCCGPSTTVSRLTHLGLNQTSRYRLPPMPWGINRDEIDPTMRRQMPYLSGVTLTDDCIPRALSQKATYMIYRTPFVRHEIPKPGASHHGSGKTLL
jgi:hypothetical protein